MPIIFFDANVYLCAYREGYKEYIKFLESANEIRPYLLVTAQIVREVSRNRLSAYLQYVTGSQKYKSKFPGAFVRYDRTREEMEKSEIQYKEIKKSIDEVEGKLDEFINEAHRHNIEMISKGQDYVWESLRIFFDNAVSETDEQLARARKRKELGDHPGKNEDALGDQLNWEQLLDRARKEEGPIMIVTNDKDYWNRDKGSLYLKPPLYQEIREASNNQEIFVFERPTDCIEYLKVEQLIEKVHLPTAEMIEAANNEVEFERELMGSNLVALQGTGSILLSTLYDGCRQSPTGRHHVSEAALRPSPLYGYKTFQGQCDYCGHWIDTLEDCD